MLAMTGEDLQQLMQAIDLRYALTVCLGVVAWIWKSDLKGLWGKLPFVGGEPSDEVDELLAVLAALKAKRAQLQKQLAKIEAAIGETALG